MPHARRRRRAPRGITLIEAVISLAVFAFGMVGILQLQTLASRSTQMARKLSIASELASDLVENIALWSYNDPRLAPGATIDSPADTAVMARTADTRLHEVPSDLQPHFAEGAINAQSTLALYDENTPYDGLLSDIDDDGEPDFERFWSVYELRNATSSIPNGKLVVVTVRWHEAGLGYRRIVQSTYRANAEAFSQ